MDLKSDDGISALKASKQREMFLSKIFVMKHLKKWGLSPSELKQKYPKLIISSCKGFLKGPYERRTAMDEVVQMMTGMAYMTGPKGRPLRIGSSANDIMAVNFFGAFSILCALFQRQSDGRGKALRVELFENCLLLVAQHMVQFDIEGREAPPMPDREFSWPIYDIFETADKRQILLELLRKVNGLFFAIF